jgi:hypothetical protein
MLFKPNRKVFEYNTWLYYDYYLHEFTNKLFAISLLNDEDFQNEVKLPPPQIDFNSRDGLFDIPT